MLSVDKLLLKAIKGHYGFNIVNSKDLYSYYGGVSEITTDQGPSYIFKYRSNVDEKGLLHHKAIVEFCDYVEKNITEFVTQKFVPNLKGEYLSHLWKNDYCYIVEKKEIIQKTYIVPKEQLLVGYLMRVFHTKLKSFNHPGLGSSEYMDGFSNEEVKFLYKHFKREEFEQYIKPFDYQEMGLEITLLHGDWHESNMSFSNPPFIYDLDTLCRGSRVEEIARSVTHWSFEKPKRELFENLVKGYEILPESEIKLILQVMLSTCYKKYAQFMLYGDKNYANEYKILVEYLKKEYNLQ